MCVPHTPSYTTHDDMMRAQLTLQPTICPMTLPLLPPLRAPGLPPDYPKHRLPRLLHAKGNPPPTSANLRSALTIQTGPKTRISIQ